MALKSANTEDLVSRFSYLINLYVPLAAELAPKIEQFGKYRRELQAIVTELRERGVSPQDPEGLKQVVEDALAKAEEK